MSDEPDDYEIPLEGYEVALGNDLSALQARIKKLEARINELEADNGYFRQVAQYESDQAADIIEGLMAERDKLQRELRRIGVEKFNG